MPTTIRAALPGDAEAIADVAAETFPLACPPESTAQDQAAYIAQWLTVARFREYLVDHDRAVFVAEDDGQVVGYTLLEFHETDDAEVVHVLSAHPSAVLSKCYVSAGLHGTGTASALMDATLKAAAERGIRAVWLGVNEQNTRAQRFYAKHNFHAVGRRQFRLGNRVEHDLVLERRLAGTRDDRGPAQEETRCA